MYNTEKYIKESLDSIISSHNDNIEIIIVDDGSDDRSLDVAESWFRENGIDGILVANNHSGPSASRNLGITLARGKYITFFDSDDIALSPVYQKLITVLDNHAVDFAMARSISFDNTTQEIFPFPDAYVWDAILHGRSFHVSTLMQEPRLARLEASSVVRVFRREFLIGHHITFPEKLFFEDAAFHAVCMIRARKIALLDDTLLFYRVNRDGQTTSSYGKRRFDMLKILDLIRKDVDQNDVPDAVGANLMGLLVRMTMWCGEHSAFEDRIVYFQKALKILKSFPKEWVPLYGREYAYDDWERTLCKAIDAADYNVLLELAEQHPIDRLTSKENGLVAHLPDARELSTRVEKILSSGRHLAAKTYRSMKKKCVK